MGRTPKQYFDEAQVTLAQQALAALLRDRPEDSAARSFLFELLCFAGDWERARKQLAILGGESDQAQLGSVLYTSAIQAEQQRHEFYHERVFRRTRANCALSGRLNGKPFSDIRDADPDLGPRFEIFAAGQFHCIPFELLVGLRIEPPKRLLDTLWASGFAATRGQPNEQDLGEVLLPALYPFSFRNSDESVWLGRLTTWICDEEGTEYPIGQRILLVDGEEVPFLEVRTLEFDPPGESAANGVS
jgi:type VI secretion system protein ImpE